MRKTRAFLLMGLGILLLGAEAPAGEARSELKLVWLDSQRAADAVRTEATAEAAALLDSAGVDVVWERTDGRQRTVHEGEVQVVVLPSAPASLSPDVMGWTHPSARGARTVWVFLSAIRAALGLRPAETRNLGRAVGRVIVHELVHLAAPARPHSHAGLMAARVGRRVLVQPGLQLDVRF